MSERQGHSAHGRRTGIAAALCLGLFLALTAAVVAHPAPFAIDEWWGRIVVSQRSDPLTSVALVFNAVGKFPWSLLVIGLVMLAVWRAGVVFGVSTLLAGEAVSFAVANLVKYGVGRSRPPHGLVDVATSSFPSGHSAFAAVTATLLVGLLCSGERCRSWWRGVGTIGAIVAILLAFTMAWSRTYLMVHWATDVAGGLLIGTAAGLGALAWRDHRLQRAGGRSPAHRDERTVT